MRILATELDEDTAEWEVIGLLHDLDYDLMDGDMSQHGIKASELLKGKLPERVLHAIKAHDHRTGVEPRALLDESLRFADSLATFIEDQPTATPWDVKSLGERLQQEAQMKPWIAEIIFKYEAQKRIALGRILMKIEIIK